MKYRARGRDFAVILAALYEKRVTLIVWLIGGALAMYFEAIAIAVELRDFPGGGAALAKSIYPTIEGMRLIRWPADRLDTLGGYLAYHNVVLFNYFFAIFAAVQGARLIRNLEQTRMIELFLATGISRVRFLILRAIAFYLSMVVISLGTGVATALAMWASDEPTTAGSIITLLAGGICVSPFFGLAILISQFVGNSRSASGITAIVVTFIYAIGNISDKYSWLAWFKYLSPFYYANLSRPLIPGFGTNYWSWFAMLAVGIILVIWSGRFFAARDIESVVIKPAMRSMQREDKLSGAIPKSEYVPKSITGDLLWRQRYGLLAWTLATMAFIGLFISLMNGVIDVWKEFAFLQQFAAAGYGNTPAEQYLALVYEVVPPFLAGYIIFQSSNRTQDLVQGRLALFLSAPISWSRLIINRVLANMVAVAIISAGAIGTILIGSFLQGSKLYLPDVARFTLMILLFGLALTVITEFLVILMRERTTTQAATVYIAAAWLVVFMAPYLNWPDWIVHLSIFDALGHPFVKFPSITKISFLAALAIPGLYLTIKVANQTPKTR